ncbi:MAG: hypothetical protein LBV08_11035 [Clostridiales bacterium]|jgi:hypothetical protein|nr:hypothetical protein [Clostridiales bacterium]
MPLNIDVVIDGRIFKKFALFDGFVVKKMWRAPLIFFAIMSASAIICIILRGKSEQALLLAALLFIIGAGLPAVYLYKFINSINIQIKKLGLETPRKIYSLNFSEGSDGFSASNIDGGPVFYKWADLFHVYRHKGCTYIYVNKNKAYIAPENQSGAQPLAFYLPSSPQR